MINDVVEIVWQQTVINRHEDSADLRHRVIGLEMGMCVWRNIRHPIALSDAHTLKRGRPTVAAIQEFGIGKSQIAVDNSFAVCIEPAGTPGKFNRGQCNFHNTILSQQADNE